MSYTHHTMLIDRAVLRLTGADVAVFLNSLLTNNILNMHSGEGRYAALLTPQGKIISDMFVVKDNAERDVYFIDLPQITASDVLRKLTLYKLRAQVMIEDVSAQLGVAVMFGVDQSQSDQTPREALIYPDPRCDQMGLRVIVSPDAWQKIHPSSVDQNAYSALRIACCVPSGGSDFVYGDVFPHDVNMDLLNGVDFKKGCYVGQEVVSRTHHRNAARTRIVRVFFPNGVCPAQGADVMAGEKRIGVLCTCDEGKALAQIRLDRLQDALDVGLKVCVDGLDLMIDHASA